ncbi:hypothetical protein O6P43_010123 [Quillaja saponaria]|uniref:Uncharacterized protein n=1 Tax=Quillaja saponaria TaxID=32244 RepID=A0AAD7PZY6_QUISA|nr:hypothetical protein O6P43_010123 [Quillaja saponaria]
MTQNGNENRTVRVDDREDRTRTLAYHEKDETLKSLKARFTESRNEMMGVFVALFEKWIISVHRMKIGYGQIIHPLNP